MARTAAWIRRDTTFIGGFRFVRPLDLAMTDVVYSSSLCNVQGVTVESKASLP
jgi:hypothetical protein